jgi:hypothetical protein
MRDPWDPLATGEETRLPDGTFTHRNADTSPEPSDSDAEYFADRAARCEEAHMLGWSW